ncbi:MAG: signal peptidase II [Rhodobacteraceae bacterium]|nr:signal peptidase II [Paracoccaceae bacterium]
MRRAGIIAGVVFALDQATKALVVHGLDLKTRLAIDVLPPWFNLRMAWNRGVNFGLLTSGAEAARWGLIAVALLISAWVWRWIAREEPGTAAQISAGLLVGGALGNVVDRVIYGAVADFLNFSLPVWTNPWAFNIADIAIFLGAVGLVLFTGRQKTP